MFDVIRRWWRIARIERAYQAYEEAARVAHCFTAERRFSTNALKAELCDLMAPHRKRCEEEFGGPIDAINQAVGRLDKSIAETRQQIDVLQTDYRAGLEPMHERSREISSLWSDLVAQKRKGHEDLESARQAISDWHNKSSSTGLFGNGGRELPRYALFGQSFGDLDGYKSDRADAVEAIRNASAELKTLKGERESLQAQITQLKEGRVRQKDLLSKGLRVPQLRDRLQRTGERREEQLEILRRAEDSRDAVLKHGWYGSGAQSVQDAIDSAELARQRFIAQFDTPEAIQRRRFEHRANFPA